MYFPSSELERLARGVIDANPAQLAKYRAGETKLLDFTFGQVMKASGGKADPAALREILGRLLGWRPAPSQSPRTPSFRAGYECRRIERGRDPHEVKR